MTARITDDEWDKLSPENFETHSLLRAVDAVDELRNDLNNGEYATLPQLRTDLLKLHQLAMAVINEGSRSQVADLFELAGDLDEQGVHHDDQAGKGTGNAVAIDGAVPGQLVLRRIGR